jgi:4-hydroxymandelate oxidase
VHIANLLGAGLGELPALAAESGLAAYFASLLDASLTWSDLDWLTNLTKLPILVKGIHRPDDALRALQHGAGGIIVSNHGGRQLDTVPAGIDLLPPIVEAVGDRAEVLVDGGVRRGTDIVKALALGAKAVLVGRPIIWGLAVSGQRGVSEVLRILKDEFDLAMALCGCAEVGSIDRGLIAGKA